MPLRLRSLLAVLPLLAACAGALAQPAPPPMLLTPEQRQQLWQRLSPEEKGRIIRDLTPEQRDALRSRMMDERMQRGDDMRGPHRMSPEERQRLRDQIYESNREFHLQRREQRDDRREDRREDRRGRGRGRD